ncbi:WAT1-related protein At1g68170 isoform X2 [Ziziphus jujuba]|uniref:WAT1-related protein n=1 Tax=Ziziphus jujuba TaxID=326968 RepID=A0A6P4AAP1_ZIZJJ|nr:WAT1-related protein At1g68170 isoform X2 [Ziziphus jujuba]
MMMKNMNISNCRVVNELKPVIVMVMTQIAYGIMNILYKLVVEDGMDFRILIVYRLLFATSFMLPIALIFERKSWQKLDRIILLQGFLCGLFGLEKVGLETKEGMAKVAGTAVGMSGAMLFTFYKGIEIKTWSVPHHHHHATTTHVSPNHKITANHLLGSFLSFSSCLSYALWLIVQAKMSKRYPFHYSGTALMCVMASVQSLAFALCVERDWTKWKLGWNLGLLTAAYSGIVTSGVVVTMIAWCGHKRGPLYVAIFNPVSLVIVALAGALFLQEKLHLGSILGGLLVVCGLYMVLWGKRKEMKMKQPPSSENPQES